MLKKNAQSGFTLVELAIVLVIIGLLVGGVLVGQDLIRAATIRSVGADIEKINAGATTFRGKYSGLPGDLLSTKAAEFGMNTTSTDANRDGSAGKGDGNGAVEGCAAATNDYGCENALFWADLSFAKLIAGNYVFDSATGAGAVAGDMKNNVPKTRLRDSALLSVFNNGGRNYMALGAQSNATAAAGAAGAITYTADSASAAVTPLEARGIDEKLDDGAPLTGTVTAIAAGTDPTVLDSAVTPAANKCVASGTPTSYTSTTDAYLNNVACALGIRASF